MIFNVWKVKRLDKGVVTDMAEQRKHNLGTYREWLRQEQENQFVLQNPRQAQSSEAWSPNPCSEAHQLTSCPSDASN